MLSRIFPRQIDNAYQGHWLALLLLVPILFVKLAMGANTMINTRAVITGPDAIPLETYSQSVQQNLVFMYQAWGLGLFLMGLLGLLALVRYRAMVPLAYLVLTLEQIGRMAFSFADFPAKEQAASQLSIALMINLGLGAALVIGFALSLGKRPSAQ